ncbi:MAG: CRISPR-associated endonuclease Cas1, partial [Ktedonobacterales bacterium]
MDLIVEGPGSFIGKHQGRLRVTRQGTLVTEAPLIHLEHVLVVDGGVGISSDAVRVCAEQGIPIHFLDGVGRVQAAMYAAGLTATIASRRAQLAAWDSPLGLALASAYVRGKIENQANTLRYMGKYRKETQPEVFEELRLTVGELRDRVAELERLLKSGVETVDEARERVLSVEGRASQRYWHVVGLLIPERLEWPGRETRGARDVFNAALNYGYAILYTQVERALVLAGLDPYGGFLHTDRPGKPSLVLDAMEEFRQAVVDRAVIALVNKGLALEQGEDGLLTEGARRRIVE